MKVYLVDGTYELFRYYFAQPSHLATDGKDVGAVRGVVSSMVSMLEAGVTHLGVATDHIVESFRNEMYLGYKNGDAIEKELLGQFSLLERCLFSLGLMVWPMIEYEADDALASASSLAANDPHVEQIVICSPDKDLAQCVVGDKIIMRNRRTEVDLNEMNILEHFGVLPASIPDWLALVGDSADGFPGLKGWGKKSAATVLCHYGHLESIPATASGWDQGLVERVRGATSLAARLAQEMEQALLFRDLATLRQDFPCFVHIDELAWNGPEEDFAEVCDYLGAPQLVERIGRVSPLF
jgi:5'-3' exonuclease